MLCFFSFFFFSLHVKKQKANPTKDVLLSARGRNGTVGTQPSAMAQR